MVRKHEEADRVPCSLSPFLLVVVVTAVCRWCLFLPLTSRGFLHGCRADTFRFPLSQSASACLHAAPPHPPRVSFFSFLIPSRPFLWVVDPHQPPGELPEEGSVIGGKVRKRYPITYMSFFVALVGEVLSIVLVIVDDLTLMGVFCNLVLPMFVK